MQNRRTFLTRSSLAFGALTFLKPLNSIAGTSAFNPSGNTLTILFTNGAAGKAPDTNTANGWQAIRQSIAAIRQEQQATLLVDTGNNLAAGAKKSISDLHSFTSLKEINYDAVAPGAADMQHGPAYFSKLVEKSRVKVVATNFNEAETGSVLSYRVVRKGALKVGVIGVGSLSNLSASRFAEVAAAIQQKAGQLKLKQECHLVVCLSHLPLKNEKNKLDNLRLAQQTSGIDVVISANDDRYTYNTHVVKNAAGYDVLLSHAGQNGTMLGRLDIAFNESGEKTSITASQVFPGYGGQKATSLFKKHAATQLAS